MQQSEFCRNKPDIFKNIFNELLDIVFPPVCCFCSRIITSEHPVKGICRKCLPQIPFRTSDNLEMPCIDKILHNHPMLNTPSNIKVLVACRYEDPLKKALLDFKFYEAAYYREFFGSMISYVFSEKIKTYDFIIPIPLHEIRKKERGFNQTELIAAKISDITGIPVLNDTLLRTGYTQRQSEMKNETDRVVNVSEAFSCIYPERLINKRLLILDDVITSGSTMCYAANSIIKSVNMHNKSNKENSCANNPSNVYITGIAAASGRK